MIKIMITFRDFICTLPDSFDEKMKDLNVPLDELARKILQSSLYHEIISVMDLIHLSILFISSIIKFNLRLLLASLYYGFVFIPLLYYKNIGHRKVWKKLNAKLTEFGFNNRTIGKYVMKAVESFDHVTDVAELFVPQSILNKN